MLLKVVLLGEGGVGKSAVTIQFIQHHFITEYDPTIENSYRKQVPIDGQVVLLEVIDTAGQEEYSVMKEQYIRVGQGFLIVYSITQKSSWDKAKAERDLILRGKDEDDWYPMVILGNKCDMEKNRQVSTEEAASYCRSIGVPHLEGSAKTRMNVEEAFHQVVREIRKYEAKRPNEEKNDGKKKKKKDGKEQNKKGDCLLI